MNLSKQEQEIKQVGQEAKSFLGSSLYKALQHHLSSKLEQEYPKPDTDGWEEKYRYAHAYEQVAAEIVQFVSGLSSQHDMLVEKEKDETDLDKA